jgi:hypothetical protein
MPVERNVLIVSPTPSLAQALASAVRQCGYGVAVARTFAEAKKALSSSPHLLITELKLGEYNGLHLSLYAGACEIPAIVVSDRHFEHEVEQLGFAWMAPSAASTGELSTVMTRLMQGAGATDAGFPWYDATVPGTAEPSAEWHVPGSSLLH